MNSNSEAWFVYGGGIIFALILIGFSSYYESTHQDNRPMCEKWNLDKQDCKFFTDNNIDGACLNNRCLWSANLYKDCKYDCNLINGTVRRFQSPGGSADTLCVCLVNNTLINVWN